VGAVVVVEVAERCEEEEEEEEGGERVQMQKYACGRLDRGEEDGVETALPPAYVRVVRESSVRGSSSLST